MAKVWNGRYCALNEVNQISEVIIFSITSLDLACFLDEVSHDRNAKRSGEACAKDINYVFLHDSISQNTVI